MRRRERNVESESAAPSGVDQAAVEKRIQILLDSTRRERDRASDRVSGTQTRATILIGAAGILGGVGGMTPGLSAWSIVSIVLYVLAALAGVVILWPLRVHTVSNATYFAKMMDYHPVDLQESILRNELNAVSHTQRRLSFRSWTLIVGFGLLAAAWACSLLVLTESPPPESPVKVQIIE